MITNENIGIKLDAIMHAQDVSNEYLAYRLGVTAQAVRNWRGGKNRPGKATVDAINRILGER